MKAKELMLFDLIRRKKDGKIMTVVELRYAETIAAITPDDVYYGDMEDYHESEVEPILITPEILKRNGFTNCETSELDRQLELYDAKHLEVEKEVKKAEDKLQKRHEKEVKELEDKLNSTEETIKDLKEQLKEASKTSEEKLAEARAKLQEAQEEVAKYAKTRKKLFGIFG